MTTPSKNLGTYAFYTGTARVMEKYAWDSAISPPSPTCCHRIVHSHLPRHIDSQVPTAQSIAGAIDICHNILILVFLSQYFVTFLFKKDLASQFI